MRTSLLIAILLTTIGCAEKGSDDAETTDCSTSPLVGIWGGDIAGQQDTMNIFPSCLVKSSYCESTALGQPGDNDSFSIRVTDGPITRHTGCLDEGETAICGYVIDGNTLFFNCGNDSLIYERIGTY